MVSADRRGAGRAVTIAYERAGWDVPVNGTAAIHVYRVLQEALNNVARHSGATAAWVRLKYEPDLELEVEDHGKVSRTRGDGLGVVAMRERAE